MAKTLRTSGDYTIRTGPNGASGSNEIVLDSKTVRVRGDLIVGGEQATVSTTNISVEDAFIELAKNNTSTIALDAGLYVNRGDSADAAVFFWDESANGWKSATTTDSAATSPLTATLLAHIYVPTIPTDNNHATSKNYVDSAVSGSGSMSSFFLAGDSGTTQTVVDADTITIAGGANINTVASATDTVTINLNQNLNNINSISNGSTNGDLILTANGTGSVIVNNILTFNSNASTPAATAITKLYSKTPGYGDTGVYFVNSAVKSGAEQELISKRKATVLAIALG